MNVDPYQPPTDLPPDHLLRPERGRGLAVAALGLMLAGTALSWLLVAAMIGAFGALAETGQADPAGLAGALPAAMWANLLGMLASIAGGALGLMAVFGAGNRERWFFHLGWIVAVLQLLTFPFGTLFGIALLFGLWMNRREFGGRADNARGEMR